MNDTHKLFLIQRLAMFDSPQEAARSLEHEFGITITPQSAEHYDPTKRSGQRLAKHLRDLFESTRKQFLEKLDAIPHANKAFRIRKLAKAADTFEAKGNLVAMSDMLVLIAKERGGSFTNQRELTGKDGKAIELDVNNNKQLNEDQLNNRILAHFVALGFLPAPVVAANDGDSTTKH